MQTSPLIPLLRRGKEQPTAEFTSPAVKVPPLEGFREV